MTKENKPSDAMGIQPSREEDEETRKARYWKQYADNPILQRALNPKKEEEKPVEPPREETSPLIPQLQDKPLLFQDCGKYFTIHHVQIIDYAPNSSINGVYKIDILKEFIGSTISLQYNSWKKTYFEVGEDVNEIKFYPAPAFIYHKIARCINRELSMKSVIQSDDPAIMLQQTLNKLLEKRRVITMTEINYNHDHALDEVIDTLRIITKNGIEGNTRRRHVPIYGWEGSIITPECTPEIIRALVRDAPSQSVDAVTRAVYDAGFSIFTKPKNHDDFIETIQKAVTIGISKGIMKTDRNFELMADADPRKPFPAIGLRIYKEDEKEKRNHEDINYEENELVGDWLAGKKMFDDENL